MLIRVAATSVNRPDLVQREGKYPAPKGESPILGLEVSGIIEGGGGRWQWQPGDPVLALVAEAAMEYAVAYAGHVMRMPEAMSFEQAACVCETYITALSQSVSHRSVGGRGGDTPALLHGLIAALFHSQGSILFTSDTASSLHHRHRVA